LCSLIMRPYRGKIQRFELAGYAAIVFGLLLIIILGIATSGSESGNWGSMVLYILLYFIFVPIVHKVSKCFQCKYLRQAHFVLAVVCRSENNRYYLSRGVEVRPGYLGRWLEFSVLDPEIRQGGPAGIVRALRARHAAHTLEVQRNVEADHQRYMEGVNRNLEAKAIEIKLEMAKINNGGKELTPEEKEKII